MPLTDSVEREELHQRRIDLRGYQRRDGLFDIEARIVDTKSRPILRQGGGPAVPPGEHLHDMWIRLVVDEHLLVHDVAAITDASPYTICREATATLARIKGLSIGRGWTRKVKERLGGSEGCTHLTELLMPLATVAFQTIYPVLRARNTGPETGKPRMIDTCYAYASHREVVLRRWPAYYTGTPAGEN